MRPGRAILLMSLLTLGSCRTAPSSEVKGTISIAADAKPSLLDAGTVLADTENHVADFTPEIIKRGPLNRTFTRLEGGKVPFPAELTCTFREPYPKDPISGMSRKFECIDDKGDTHKVKYGVDNPEVYYEVLVSRLFWVLGFYSDRNYPVRVTCKNCPRAPWPYIQKSYDLYKKGASLAAIQIALSKEEHVPVTVFEEAIIEEKTGDKLEVIENGETGWGFHQLRPLVLPDDPKCESGKCERIYREGLIVLASFILHMDSKIDNQKIFCIEDGKKAKANCPSHQIGLMIQDGGASFLGYQFDVFGRIIPVPAKTELALWDRYSVWKDKRPCQIALPTTPGGILSDQTIVKATVSEAGRAFIAERLKALSSAQLDALLEAARLDRRIAPGLPADAPENRDYKRKFREALQAKIAAIADVTCPYRLETNVARYPE